MIILGISAYYHDSAAALLCNGHIIAAAQEERFTRIKHDPRFPTHAVDFCLREAGISAADVDHVVFYEDPRLKLGRIMRNHIENFIHATWQMLERFPSWYIDKYFYRHHIQKALGPTFKGSISCIRHHLSHAASAFYPPPFEEATVLTIDGVGESETATIAHGLGNRLETVSRLNYPHSAGLLYSAFTAYCGFKVNSGEYKLMGLAPYGSPQYAEMIESELVHIAEDGSIRLNLEYFPYCHEDRMYNDALIKRLGFPDRKEDGELLQAHADLAASIQKVIEKIVVRMARHARSVCPGDNLCLAGGVALNCVANRHILMESGFSNLWIQPAAGDAGGALGAALFHYHHTQGNGRQPDPRDQMQGALLGPAFDDETIATALDDAGLHSQQLDEASLLKQTAHLLAEGQVVGWFQGRMEFGPRALGSRSILGDPRNRTMQRNMNLKIKFRESFRPFAPAILEEKMAAWFDTQVSSPYMLRVAEVKEEHRLPRSGDVGLKESINHVRSTIPAVTHVDYSARLQTVSSDTNDRFAGLLREFEALTGVPILINTSFNVRGEPIVCHPTDAVRCFINTGIDVLAIGSFLIKKSEQSQLIGDTRYVDSFEKD